MKFAIPALLFSGVVFSAALQPRDAKDVVAAIAVIKSDIKSLTSSVSSFNGDFAQAIQIQVATQQLSDDIQQATQTTDDSPKFTNSQSASIGLKLQALSPKIFKLLDIIVAKKPEFDRTVFGFGSTIVLQDLKDQKSDTDDFGLAIQKKLTKTYAKLAPAVRRKIDKHFDKAIAAYS